MINYRQIFYSLIVVSLISSCTPTKLTYIKFGEEKTISTNHKLIKHYLNRLDIKSEFVELGVIIIEGSNEPDIEEVRLFAAEKGAGGFIKEGKNFVLIKVLNKNPKEVIDQNSKEVINVFKYKKYK